MYSTEQLNSIVKHLQSEVNELKKKVYLIEKMVNELSIMKLELNNMSPKVKHSVLDIYQDIEQIDYVHDRN